MNPVGLTRDGTVILVPHEKFVNGMTVEEAKAIAGHILVTLGSGEGPQQVMPYQLADAWAISPTDRTFPCYYATLDAPPEVAALPSRSAMRHQGHLPKLTRDQIRGPKGRR